MRSHHFFEHTFMEGNRNVCVCVCMPHLNYTAAPAGPVDGEDGHRLMHAEDDDVTAQEDADTIGSLEASAHQKDLVFWRRFRAIATLVLPPLYSLETCLWVIQIGLGVLYAWSYVEMSNNAGEVMTAISEGNYPAFVKWSLWITFAAFVGSVSSALMLAAGDYLCLALFRTRLTQRITDMYIQNKMYFKLIHLDREVVDPDARIVSDVHTLCLKLKLILFGTPMYTGYIGVTANTLYFIVILANEAGWFVPFITVVFFIITTVISQLLTYNPSRLAKRFGDENSALHTLHSYFATHSEHIAFLDGHRREDARFRNQLSRTRFFVIREALWRFPLNFVTMFFYWGNNVVSNVVPGFAWLWMHNQQFSNDYTFLANVTSSLYSFVSTMTNYILLFQEWSELVGSVVRVGELLDTMERVRQNPMYEGNVVILPSSSEPGAPLVEVQHVTLLRPGSNQVLIHDVSFSVCETSSVVIMGPSGVGKSSLLRVLGGLWPATQGTIRRPQMYGRGGIMFLPQKPYLTIDCLAAQIVYPEKFCRSATNDMHLELLREVGLEYLAKQFDMTHDVRDWSQILSVGEQQRVAVARVLYTLPRVVIMDESTSAMDEPNEATAFEALSKRHIALLSVAHRSTVMKFHQRVLRVHLDGTWSIDDVT